MSEGPFALGYIAGQVIVLGLVVYLILRLIKGRKKEDVEALQ